MTNFRTLDLATEFYGRVRKLKIEGHLRDQLMRGSTSIALNLSEGNAKFSINEKKRFYQMAYASQKECQTIMKLLEIEDQELLKTLDHLGASLFKLLRSEIKSLDSKFTPKN